ncbi:MAG: DUF58 domain-containing protein [Gammaproteobacteria bacterium]|nr:DUF58 domain-containing protein [Gammaproteobacteria bacterium]MBD3776760.1 DUF58 domain-containing protein [Thiotrichales bacterium]
MAAQPEFQEPIADRLKVRFVALLNLKKRLAQPFRGITPRAQQPLLSADQIQVLAAELSGLAGSIPRNPKPSSALRQGEQTSRFMGNGLEYEESRPYQLGDEIRRINWRLMARTGQAYTKLFQEERQEDWFILLDQRMAMRFGTRVRLKAEQALRVAGYFLWLAEKAALNLPVEGARLAEELVFTPTFIGRGSYTQMMQAFSQPCPPPAAKVSRIPEPTLNAVLNDLSQRLQPGSRLIMISDFHDLDEACLATLTALQQFARVKAVCIEDAAERVLPAAEGVQLQSMVSGEPFELHGEALQNYQVWAEAHLQDRLEKLQRVGVKVNRLLADDSLQSLVEQLEWSA